MDAIALRTPPVDGAPVGSVSLAGTADGAALVSIVDANGNTPPAIRSLVISAANVAACVAAGVEAWDAGDEEWRAPVAGDFAAGAGVVFRIPHAAAGYTRFGLIATSPSPGPIVEGGGDHGVFLAATSTLFDSDFAAAGNGRAATLTFVTDSRVNVAVDAEGARVVDAFAPYLIVWINAYDTGAAVILTLTQAP